MEFQQCTFNFLENLEQPMEHRQLSIGAEEDRSDISGPLVLLQLWSWSHVEPGCPKNIAKKSTEGEEQGA